MPTVHIGDATVTTTTTANGQTVTVTPDPGSPADNALTLLSRAQAALANNAAYLAIPSPTQAQAITQVGALTRQVDGLIRFALTQFAAIADS
jgi:hypothetical protein